MVVLANIAVPGILVSTMGKHKVHPASFDAEGTQIMTAFVEVLENALGKADLLEARANQGYIIRRFGHVAQSIIDNSTAHVGDAAPDLERALDGVFHSLFLQQLATVRQQLTDMFERDLRPASVLARADKEFVARAEELLRPGSDWSYEPERKQFLKTLEQILHEHAALARERSRVALMQRATSELINRLLTQMEELGEKMYGPGGGSPWVFWTSYKIPRTPFHIVGKYRQGRTNIELSLGPSKDPVNAEAGFVEGLTRQNLGLSLNLGV